MRYHGTAVYTNKSPSCAMQGFGNPQVTFAVESLMDELAEKLDMDPIELRLKNYVGLGDTFWGQGPHGALRRAERRRAAVAAGGAKLIGWERRGQNQVDKETSRQGEPASSLQLQLQAAYRARHRHGARLPHLQRGRAAAGRRDRLLRRDGQDQPGRLGRCHLDRVMDHGGGTLEAFAKIVAEALCVPLDKVNISPGRHAHDRLRRRHARHARRVRRRRRGAQGHAKVREDLLQTAALFHERPARGADNPDGRGAGPGRGLCALHARAGR